MPSFLDPAPKVPTVVAPTELDPTASSFIPSFLAPVPKAPTVEAPAAEETTVAKLTALGYWAPPTPESLASRAAALTKPPKKNKPGRKERARAKMLKEQEQHNPRAAPLPLPIPSISAPFIPGRSPLLQPHPPRALQVQPKAIFVPASLAGVWAPPTTSAPQVVLRAPEPKREPTPEEIAVMIENKRRRHQKRRDAWTERRAAKEAAAVAAGDDNNDGQEYDETNRAPFEGRGCGRPVQGLGTPVLRQEPVEVVGRARAATLVQKEGEEQGLSASWSM